MRQRSSAHTRALVVALPPHAILPARSGLTPSAAPVSLLPSHGLTRCCFPSRCLGFLRSSSISCARCSSPRSTSGVAEAEQWRRRVEAVRLRGPDGLGLAAIARSIRAVGDRRVPLPSLAQRRALGAHPPDSAPAKRLSCASSCTSRSPLGLSGAVVLRACLAVQIKGCRGYTTRHEYHVSKQPI
jgi:hypothetical protein